MKSLACFWTLFFHSESEKKLLYLVGLMTSTPFCQLLSFTVWVHKTKWVSALNGHLVSVGPAGSGSAEHSHAEPALLQHPCRCNLAECCCKTRPCILSCCFGKVTFPWELLYLRHQNRAGLSSWSDWTHALLWHNRLELLFCLHAPAAWHDLETAHQVFFLHIHLAIIILFALLPQAAGESERPWLGKWGRGDTAEGERAQEHGVRRRLNLQGQNKAVSWERQRDWKINK